MTTSILEAAFAHNTWATLRVINACTNLSQEQLATNVPGTRGPILDTLRHIVEGDAVDLEIILTGIPAADLEQMGLPELRVVASDVGAAWARFLADPIDPDQMVREVDPGDGYERDAPMGFRLAGTLNHGSDHRSQICTALTTLGVTPPRIDVMDYGLAVNRVFEKWPEGEQKG